MTIKHPISETFLSIEGEAKYVGVPTAYIRYAGCNMKCAGFNNPTLQRDADGYAPLTFDVSKLTSLEQMPEISMGCDSQYAVNPTFKHLWQHLTADELAQQLTNMLPNKSWTYGTSQQKSIMLSLTGGEPTLRWKIIPEILNHELLQGVQHVLIETNCSVPLKPTFLSDLDDWLSKSDGRKITWSNSPKLKVSGEDRDKAIRPDIAVAQMSGERIAQYEQYFKFVCDDSDESFAEVASVMNQYYDGGVPLDAPVYIMPVSCTEQQQRDIMKSVALKCIQCGYIYCHRVHLDVFGNAIGT